MQYLIIIRFMDLIVLDSLLLNLLLKRLRTKPDVILCTKLFRIDMLRTSLSVFLYYQNKKKEVIKIINIMVFINYISTRSEDDPFVN